MHKELLKILPAEIMKFNEPMKNHTTFQIGGPVDVMIIPHDREQVPGQRSGAACIKCLYLSLAWAAIYLYVKKGSEGWQLKSDPDWIKSQ